MAAKRTFTATAKDLARLLGVTQRSIARFQDEGMPVLKRGRGRRPSQFDVAACFHWYLERTKADLVGDETNMSPQKARMLLDLRRKEELELKLRVRRGELVEQAQVEHDFADCALRVKARLRRVPDALADVVLKAGSPQAAKTLMLTAIDDALRELAAGAGANETSSAA